MNRAWWLLLGLAACSEAKPRTQVFLVVDADPGVRLDAARLSLTIRGGRGVALEERLEQTVSGTDLQWPLRLAMVPLEGDASRTYVVEAEALDITDARVGFVRARSGYVPAQTKELRLVLEDCCRGIECSADQTCRACGCAPAAIAPADLPTYTEEARRDGGVVDGGLDTVLYDSGSEDSGAGDASIDGTVFCEGIDRISHPLHCGACGLICSDGLNCRDAECRSVTVADALLFAGTGDEPGFHFVSIPGTTDIVGVGQTTSMLEFDGEALARASDTSYDIYAVRRRRDGSVVWQRSFPFLRNQALYAITSDGVNLYAAGHASGQVDFGSGMQVAAGSTDIVILALRITDGSTAWSHLIGSGVDGTTIESADSISVQDGKVWVGATFNGSISVGADTLTSRGAADALVVRLSSSGVIESAWAFGSASDDRSPGVVAFDGGRAVIVLRPRQPITVGAAEYSPTGSSDVLLLPVQGSGSLGRVTQISGSGADDCNPRSTLSRGTTGVIACSVTMSAVLGGRTVVSRGGRDAAALEISADGDILRSWIAGGSDDDAGLAAAIDSAGNIALAFEYRTAFDPGRGFLLGSSGGQDAGLVSWTPDGVVRWAYAWGSSGLDRAVGVVSVEDAWLIEINSQGDLRPTASSMLGRGGWDSVVVRLVE